MCMLRPIEAYNGHVPIQWHRTGSAETQRMPSEQDIIEGCRRGDREARWAMYSRTSERIYRLLVRLTGSHDDASDVTQDTYIKAFTRIHQFDGRSSLSTWLHRIAVNEGLGFLRRAKRARRDREAAAGGVPQAQDQHTELRLDMEHGIAQLSDADRAILLLRYQQGLDYHALAEVLGCREGTVASRLNRARDRLRAILAPSYGPGEDSGVGSHPRLQMPVGDDEARRDAM